MNKPSGGPEPALLLSPEAPYPLAGGGPMRTASLLHYLARRRSVHLITFREPGAADAEPALPPGMCDRFSQIPLPPHRKNFLARAWRNAFRLARGRLPLMDRFSQPDSLRRVQAETELQRYSLAIVEHFWCAEYVEILRRRAKRVVLDLHNVDSALHAGCARTESWPASAAHRLFHRRALVLERELLPKFDLVLTTSDADADRVREISPNTTVAVYPNALPLLPQPAADLDADTESIAFSGNMEYHPNVTAVQFFHSKVWPRLRSERPGLRWKLIGKNERAVRAIVGGDPRIELTGAIDDPLAELAKCRLAVVPLQAGSGTRVKIVEAWAAGRAVVSSPIGAEGLPAEDGVNVVLAEKPEQWVETVIDLLQNRDSRSRLGAAGRSTYERDLSWPAAWLRLDETLSALERLAGSDGCGWVMAE